MGSLRRKLKTSAENHPGAQDDSVPKTPKGGKGGRPKKRPIQDGEETPTKRKAGAGKPKPDTNATTRMMRFMSKKKRTFLSSSTTTSFEQPERQISRHSPSSVQRFHHGRNEMCYGPTSSMLQG